MKPLKLKPEDAVHYLKDALCEHCEKECDTCDCIHLCKYGTAYKMAKEALTTQVAYICTDAIVGYPCKHTTDIHKARNFKEVQPGSWIELMHDVSGEWIEQENGIVVCSRCTKIKRDFRAGHDLFCNACGAYMRKEGDAK